MCQIFFGWTKKKHYTITEQGIYCKQRHNDRTVGKHHRPYRTNSRLWFISSWITYVSIEFLFCTFEITCDWMYFSVYVRVNPKSWLIYWRYLQLRFASFCAVEHTPVSLIFFDGQHCGFAARIIARSHRDYVFFRAFCRYEDVSGVKVVCVLVWAIF